MSSLTSLVRSVRVAPESVTAETFLLSPNDIFPNYCTIPLTWPMFYNYDIDGDRFLEALNEFLTKYPILCGRIQPDSDTRYVIKVHPDEEENHGIVFSEWKSDISVATAILEHTHVKVESATFPIMPEKPFFMEFNDHEALLKGEAPLMKAKLTHFNDGCVVNVSIQHMVMDGQRYIEAIRDIALAYCGEEIPERCHNRVYLWPDQIAKYFDFLGEDVAKLPRRIPPVKLKFPQVEFPEDSCENRALYFPNGVLAKMKAIVKPFLSNGEFVSTNDVLVAFCWLLGCELMAKTKPISNGTDLDVSNTFLCISVEALKNGINVVPENYSGNAFMVCPVMNLGDELNGTSITEAFAKLALVIRKTVSSVKETPMLAAQGMLSYYHMLSTGEVPSPVPVERMRGMSTTLLKTPIDEIDFEGGPPVFALILPLPFVGTLWAIGPGLEYNGALVHSALLGSQVAAFKESVVVKELAPCMRELYSDFTEEDLRSRLGLQEE